MKLIKSNSLSQNRRLTAQGVEFDPFVPFEGNPICDRCNYRQPHPPHEDGDNSFHPPMENLVVCEECGQVLGNIDAEDFMGAHDVGCSMIAAKEKLIAALDAGRVDMSILESGIEFECPDCECTGISIERQEKCPQCGSSKVINIEN